MHSNKQKQLLLFHCSGLPDVQRSDSLSSSGRLRQCGDVEDVVSLSRCSRAGSRNSGGDDSRKSSRNSEASERPLSAGSVCDDIIDIKPAVDYFLLEECRVHVDSIENYIEKQRWSSKPESALVIEKAACVDRAHIPTAISLSGKVGGLTSLSMSSDNNGVDAVDI